ncbi:MAG: molybdopterin-synthase adenylyltransferase MoeB, partial [Gaiellales bacterium]
ARWIDVREPDEVHAAAIPGVEHEPLGGAAQAVLERYPDRNEPILFSCRSGARSMRMVEQMRELGYRDVLNVGGGINAWIAAGLPVERATRLTDEQRDRYSRHIAIPELGANGQQQLLDARVLLLGAGGLGSPAGLYLAAAGIGTLGIVDDDVVERSNLQRQVLHGEDRLGVSKAESAATTIANLNPDVNVIQHQLRMTAENVAEILDEGWDVIVDGTDNLPTRYLLNEAAVPRGIPVVHGSIYRFEGQVTVFSPFDGPCYRCLYPDPPPPELAPSCAEGGVLGVLPGVIGSMQAVETIKLVLGIGESLAGRLWMYDALSAETQTITLQRNPDCPTCATAGGR